MERYSQVVLRERNHSGSMKWSYHANAYARVPASFGLSGCWHACAFVDSRDSLASYHGPISRDSKCPGPNSDTFVTARSSYLSAQNIQIRRVDELQACEGPDVFRWPNEPVKSFSKNFGIGTMLGRTKQFSILEA